MAMLRRALMDVKRSANPARTHGQRFVLVVMWVAGALLTLVAGADLAGGL